MISIIKEKNLDWLKNVKEKNKFTKLIKTS